MGSPHDDCAGSALTKLREKLVSDFGQTVGDYDYSVVKKLSITGTLNAQDYADLRNASYAGTSIEELDLSGAVDATTYALNGMTALTDVSLPPVANYTVANPFQGNVSLRNVVVAAETYTFGSPTTFNGITTLERITFLHTTKPSLNASTFNGSNNADSANRVVKAVVPNQDRGDYDKASFSQYFASVTEKASAADLGELETVTDEAKAIGHGAAAAEFRWTLLQDAITKATTVHDDADASAAAVYGARLALQTAISRIGVADLGLSLKVTHGADVTLSWKNGTAQHFAEHTVHPLAKVDALSNNDYDVYVPTTTIAYTTQHIASAVIPGQTDKVAKIFTVAAATAGAQYTLDLTPLAGRQESASLIPGLGAGDNRGLYTNLDDTGVLNLDVGERFDLDTIRTQQAQLDQINNLFIEPEYTFEVAGDSVTTRRIGQDGRRQLRIKAESPGVSVVKITYGPLHYLAANDNGTPGNTNWSFNGIDPQNTGVAVVNVGDNVGTFETGINVKNELDTYYFDKTAEERDFTFTPAEGTTVRVHDPLNVSDWGEGWNTYEAAPDGGFTVKQGWPQHRRAEEGRQGPVPGRAGQGRRRDDHQHDESRPVVRCGRQRADRDQRYRRWRREARGHLQPGLQLRHQGQADVLRRCDAIGQQRGDAVPDGHHDLQRQLHLHGYRRQGAQRRHVHRWPRRRMAVPPPDSPGGQAGQPGCCCHRSVPLRRSADDLRAWRQGHDDS
ncbi:hypothetical protein [Aeromicrobium sp. UC242_57]|uniref:hypothetical protein n=1 Tax=Aeromicrobium sp. UC242_57 TaxID=3374624 RepID=UPI00378B601A